MKVQQIINLLHERWKLWGSGNFFHRSVWRKRERHELQAERLLLKTQMSKRALDNLKRENYNSNLNVLTSEHRAFFYCWILCDRDHPKPNLRVWFWSSRLLNCKAFWTENLVRSWMWSCGLGGELAGLGQGQWWPPGGLDGPAHPLSPFSSPPPGDPSVLPKWQKQHSSMEGAPVPGASTLGSEPQLHHLLTVRPWAGS